MGLILHEYIDIDIYIYAYTRASMYLSIYLSISLFVYHITIIPMVLEMLRIDSINA